MATLITTNNFYVDMADVNFNRIHLSSYEAATYINVTYQSNLYTDVVEYQ